MNRHVDPTLAEKLSAAPDGRRTSILFRYMEARGQTFYDESVTQLQHALQCANQAREEGGTDEEVVSALLHDFGHFLMVEHDATGDFLVTDLEHEEVGAEYLEAFFPPAVTEPIKLHVPAKRYLCTVDPTYQGGLSRASKRSLELQGGTMSDQERAAFERNAHLESAVKLRRWDDCAKLAGLEVPPLDSYQKEVEACLK